MKKAKIAAIATLLLSLPAISFAKTIEHSDCNLYATKEARELLTIDWMNKLSESGFNLVISPIQPSEHSLVLEVGVKPYGSFEKYYFRLTEKKDSITILHKIFDRDSTDFFLKCEKKP